VTQYLTGLDGPLPAELVTVVYDGDEYALDVKALTSNYQCIYGRGCQGTTPLRGEGPGQHRPADPAVGGCCRTTPGYAKATTEVGDETATDDSPLRIRPYVEQLQPDEAQHHEQIAAGEWYTEVLREDGYWDARNAGVAGNCIFLNTEMSNGKTGCALFHLATRLGVDPEQTRPKVCHYTPAAVFVIADPRAGGGRRLLVTLHPPWFGWFAADGYFCTSDPAAYSATEPVFRRMASEFSGLLGADVYAALLPTLEQIWAERGERLKKSWGQPTPLPAPRWAT
jgi:hypothetical protein